MDGCAFCASKLASRGEEAMFRNGSASVSSSGAAGDDYMRLKMNMVQ